MSWWQPVGAEPGRVAVAPSILAADPARLADEVAAVAAVGADIIHVDVMDGHFVDNLSFGPHVVRALRETTELPLDCHLMVDDPVRYARRFAEAGADAVSVHWEVEFDHAALARELRAGGSSPGIVVNPRTDLGPRFRGVLGEFDFVLLMSVHPGFGGQSFDPGALPKLETLVRWRREDSLDLGLEIDGGINLDTAELARGAGADILVAGSAIFGSSDYGARVAALRGSAPSNPE